MAGPDLTDERIAVAAATYRRDVAVLDPGDVLAIMQAADLASSAQVFQACLLHA